MNKVNRLFYFWSYLGASLISGITTTILLIAGKGRIAAEYIPLTMIIGVINVYAFVVLALLVYKMWKVIPSSLARTTPGKAVGFLFIPLFNLYWYFPALWGWAKDWNSYAEEEEEALPLLPEWIPLTIAVISLFTGTVGIIITVAGLEWLAFLLSSPSYVLVPFFIFKVCALLDKAPLFQNPPAESQQPVRFGIASLILGVLSIPLPYIGLICGITAIVLAVKQRKIFREGLSTAGLITGIIGTVIWGLVIIFLVVFFTALSS